MQHNLFDYLDASSGCPISTRPDPSDLDKPVEAVVYGNNDILIEQVCRLYLNDGDAIADITYGRGVFWKSVSQDIRNRVTGSDIITVPERPYDFRNLPYADKSFDVVVLDPPYIHGPGKHHTDRAYQNAATTAGMNHNAIRQLYVDGMKEAARISRRHGWIKCKDQIDTGMQRWSHCELMVEALNMGMFVRDMFICIPTSQTARGRWVNQYHARKPHSFLLICEHISKKTEAQIKREGILDAMKPLDRPVPGDLNSSAIKGGQ